MITREDWLSLELGDTFYFQDRTYHFKACIISRPDGSEDYIRAKVLESFEGTLVPGEDEITIYWGDPSLDTSNNMYLKRTPMEELEAVRKRIERDLA